MCDIVQSLLLIFKHMLNTVKQSSQLNLFALISVKKVKKNNQIYI
jgi:hypothetical protein